MQCEPVEEVSVAEVKAEVVALENASGLQEHIVLLSANRTLRDPLALKHGVVQPSAFPAGPLEQGRRLAPLHTNVT